MACWGQYDWRTDFAVRAEQDAIRYRALGCFDLANSCEEDALAYRGGFDRCVSASISRNAALPHRDRIELSKKSEVVFDQLRDEGVELAHSRPFGPSRKGSSSCESGSIASGGTKTYCTCDRCF